jgi:hypothetical protein
MFSRVSNIAFIVPKASQPTDCQSFSQRLMSLRLNRGISKFNYTICWINSLSQRLISLRLNLLYRLPELQPKG